MIPRYKKTFVSVIVLIGISLILSNLGERYVKKGGICVAFAQESVMLTTDDCIKCHPNEPAAIEEKGEKHKTDVSCFDCHVAHPPLKEVIIPQCSECHTDTPHYSLENCSSCHTNTHTPLEITIGEDITKPCLSCHLDVGKSMEESPSAHSEQACSYCHSEHKKIPDCMQCHEPHTPEMTKPECLGCHPVHTPLIITYNMETPSSICASCHATALDQLKTNVNKHSEKTCAFCHRDRHRMVPTCETCHGTPHPSAMHKKFPKCAECHNTAHNLDRVDVKK
ncbi:MAG: cytochrome C [Thermodesulfobacteriota bacterium]|nr:cytochrome C [Thermodesulfobacteriota bacterium]